MYSAYKMFLLAAEEHNFTRAAERAHVTQQCLSSYIKNLEKEYGVVLFERRPRLRLTPSGQALYQSLKQIDRIEDGLRVKLNEIRDGSVGHITFGVNSTRAQIFLPSLFDRYHRLFPKVTLSVILDDTVNLVSRMMDKKLDIFLGVSCVPNDYLELIPVRREPMYLVATNEVLRGCYTGSAPWQDLCGNEVIDLRDFENIPLTGNPGTSTASTLIDQYLVSQNIRYQRILAIGDYNTQISLCGRNVAAMFCSLLILDTLLDYNKFKPNHGKLLSFRVKNLTDTLRIDIVRPKNVFMPYFLQSFADNLHQSLNDYYEKIERNLAAE